MIVKQFMTGGDRNYGYLVACEETRQAAVIDCSYNPGGMADWADAEGVMIAYIFSTHGHGDHTCGNAEMAERTEKTPLLYGDTDPVSGIPLQDNAALPLGTLTITILHTPGHTDDGMCLLVGDALFTGDTLFVGKVGGTHTDEHARQEFDSLHNKILALPEATRIFPGHNYGTAPESTVGHEKQTNPFLLQPDLEQFIHLKANWAEYKKQHGIA